MELASPAIPCREIVSSWLPHKTLTVCVSGEGGQIHDPIAPYLRTFPHSKPFTPSILCPLAKGQDMRQRSRLLFRLCRCNLLYTLSPAHLVLSPNLFVQCSQSPSRHSSPHLSSATYSLAARGTKKGGEERTYPCWDNFLLFYHSHFRRFLYQHRTGLFRSAGRHSSHQRTRLLMLCMLLLPANCTVSTNHHPAC